MLLATSDHEYKPRPVTTALGSLVPRAQLMKQKVAFNDEAELELYK